MSRGHDAVLTYLKGVYLELLEKGHPDPSLDELVDAGVYLRSRIPAIGCKLQALKKVGSATVCPFLDHRFYLFPVFIALFHIFLHDGVGLFFWIPTTMWRLNISNRLRVQR